MTFEEFALLRYPRLKEQYELQKIVDTKPDSLIGKLVIATRAGFSCGPEGGTVMQIACFKDFHNVRHVHFDDPNNKTDNGWGCRLDELSTAVKLL